MTSLADLTSRVCEAFEPLFQKKKLVLKRAFASDEERLFLDEDRIAQVLTNLLDNALKFTSQGSVEVQVLNEKNHVVCQINDTGMGIDPKDLPHLLNPAREASSKHTSMLRGTGLGLSLAKKILRLHEGSLEVKSTPQKGTSVLFKLPKKTPEAIFREASAIALKEALRGGETLSWVIMDFEPKGVLQDALGTEKGEELLGRFETIVQENLRRKNDFVVRLNDSLKILLPETSKTQARPAMARVENSLRLILEEEQLKEKARLNIKTISYPDDGTTEEELFGKSIKKKGAGL